MKNIVLLFATLILLSCNSDNSSIISSAIETIGNSQAQDTIKLETKDSDTNSKSKNIDISTLSDEVWIDGLKTPWGLVFLDDDRALVTERSGNIKLIISGEVQDMVYYHPDGVVEYGEGGMMGMVLDSDYNINKYIYLMYSYRDNGYKNKVVRITDFGDIGGDEEVILDNIPGAQYHNGGRIIFGPDDKLYISTGDASNPDNAQTKNSLAGKTLRINKDGSIPSDNPDPNSIIYTMGNRNIQGLAFNELGDMFASSHGPTGEFGLRNKDRILDHLVPNGNYGWPFETGYSNNPNYRDPILYSNLDSTPPAGITFWGDKIFIATLKSEKIIYAKLQKDSDGYKVIDIGDYLEGKYGRLREVVVGPDDSLYILTSNADGRGNTTKYGNTDKIIKVSR